MTTEAVCTLLPDCKFVRDGGHSMDRSVAAFLGSSLTPATGNQRYGL